MLVHTTLDKHQIFLMTFYVTMPKMQVMTDLGVVLYLNLS